MSVRSLPVPPTRARTDTGGRAGALVAVRTATEPASGVIVQVPATSPETARSVALVAGSFTSHAWASLSPPASAGVVNDETVRTDEAHERWRARPEDLEGREMGPGPSVIATRLIGGVRGARHRPPRREVAAAAESAEQVDPARREGVRAADVAEAEVDAPREADVRRDRIDADADAEAGGGVPLGQPRPGRPVDETR